MFNKKQTKKQFVFHSCCNVSHSNFKTAVSTEPLLLCTGPLHPHTSYIILLTCPLRVKTGQSNTIYLLRRIRAEVSDRTDAFHPSVSDDCTCAHAALRSAFNAAYFNIRKAFDKGQKEPVRSKQRQKHHLYQLTNMLFPDTETILWL